MKSDTRYSHIVNVAAKSGKTMKSGENRHFAGFPSSLPLVSTVLPAVYAH